LFFVVGSARVAGAQSVPPGVPGSTGVPAPLATVAPLQTASPGPQATAPSMGPRVGGTPEPSPSPTPPTGRRLDTFFVSADHIDFYSSRFIVGADGHVDARLGDGTHITGNTFSMDLRLNRFVIAGDVTITAGGTTLHGAAFSEFFDFDRAYFIPITSEPDRWTFAAGDYAHPLLGREMPGDTFYLPDFSGDRIFLTAQHATIDPHQSVRFTPASVNFGLGQFIRFPSYFLNFSPNPNFAQNSLPDAFVDGPLDFAGGEHDLLTAHIRYDAQNKIFPAIEGHIVSDSSYIVGSVSPLTRPLKQYNLLAFDRVSPGLQVQTDFQETAFQHSFTQPLSATGFAQTQITGSLRQSYLQLATQSYYDSLLAMPAPQLLEINAGPPPVYAPYYFYGDDSHNFVPDHPTQLQLSWIGYRQKFGKYLYSQVRSQFTYAHNSETPLTNFGGVNYTSLYGKSFGINISTKTFSLLKDRAKRPMVYLTGTFDKQRTFSSLPHYVDTQQERVSLTDIVIPNRLSALVAYSIDNTGDFYGKQQDLAYPPGAAAQYFNPYTGQLITQYTAFRGFATTRSTTLQFVYTPSSRLTTNLSLREDHDFPVPIPGPAVATTGTITGFQNYGATPLEADLDVRFRFTPNLTFDISRAYYFGFGGYERISPQFNIQVLK
jgi:hypothetical protein